MATQTPEASERPSSQGTPSNGISLGVLDDSIGPATRMLRNLLTARVFAAFEPFGLRSGTFSTMALIEANVGCSQSEIAREIGTDKSIVVAIVDELEKRGLAERHRSTEDRRRNRLTLTRKGKALMMKMKQLGRDVEQPIRDALGEEQAAQLICLTRRAVDAINNVERPDAE